MPQNSNYPWLTDEIESELTSGIDGQSREKSVIISLEGSGADDEVVLTGQVGQWVCDRTSGCFRIIIGDGFVAVEFSISLLGTRLTDIRSCENIRINAPRLRQLNLPNGHILANIQRGDLLTSQHEFSINDDDVTTLQPYTSATFDSVTPNRLAPIEDVLTHRRQVRDDLPLISRLLQNTVQLLDYDQSPVWTEQFLNSSYVENFSQINAGPADQDGALWLQIAFINDRRRGNNPSDFRAVYSFIYLLSTVVMHELSRGVANPTQVWQRWIDGLRIRVDRYGISKSVLITWSEPAQQQRFDYNYQPCDIEDPLGFIPVNLEISPFQSDWFQQPDPVFVPSHYSPDWEYVLYLVEGATYHQQPQGSVDSLLQDAYQAWNIYSGGHQLSAIRDRTFGIEIEVVGIGTGHAAEYIQRHNIVAEPEEYNHQTRNHWKCVPDASLLATRGAIRLPEGVSDEPDDDEIAIGPDCNTPQAFPDFIECERNMDEEPCEDERCRRCNIIDEEEMSGEWPGSHSAEIVSPILTYGNASDWQQLTKVIDALDDAGARVNRRCGFHVHVDVRDLSMKQLADVVNTYLNISWLFDQLLDRSRRNNFNCRHLTNEQRQELNDMLVRQGVTPEGDSFRYTSINVSAYLRQGTIEFRQHQGTLDFEKMKNWIHLCVGMVQAAGENRLSSQPDSPDPEYGILSILDQMVDGPTALWFLQRRRQLNSITALQQTQLDAPHQPQPEPESTQQQSERNLERGWNDISVRISEIVNDESGSNPSTGSNIFSWSSDPLSDQGTRTRF